MRKSTTKKNGQPIEDLINEDEIEICEKKLIIMVQRIYALERENAKTRKQSESALKKEIRKIIEEEEAKCY